MSADRIAELNDAFRTTMNPALGRIIMTSSVAALSDADRAAVFEKIKTFADFREDNDPYREHDFVRIEHNGTKYYAKMDYFDLKLEFGSEDPADPSKTIRVLTIMEATDY